MYTQKQDGVMYIYIYIYPHEQKSQDCSRPKNEQKHLTIKHEHTAISSGQQHYSIHYPDCGDQTQISTGQV